MLHVSLGIDVEPDCPPYLATQYRGIERGLPRILDAVDALGIQVTCFCTGQVAERYPDRIRDLLDRGHELACHGHTHARFDRMDERSACAEIATATGVLRGFGAPVTSFRAPNLRLPSRYLAVLEAHGYRVDSSQAKYKAEYYRPRATTNLVRVPASMTSSVLRLPRWIRDPWLASLASPVVLFVHPWEFVDLTRERLRLDCRFRTGNPAIRAVQQVVEFYLDRGATFTRIDALGSRLAA